MRNVPELTQDTFYHLKSMPHFAGANELMTYDTESFCDDLQYWVILWILMTFLSAGASQETLISDRANIFIGHLLFDI